MNDEEDPGQEPAPIKSTGQMGQKFTCCGIDLNPFSLTHKEADLRIYFDNDGCSISAGEGARNLVYLLTLSAREASKVRGKAIPDFRVKCDEWAEKLIAEFPDAVEQMLETAKQIRGDVEAAESVEPNAPNAPGNA